MSKIGRNEPCPCGSGLKFKKCCQALEEAAAGRRRDEDNAVRAALDWLWERYPDEVDEALEFGFFGVLDDAQQRAGLPPQFDQMMMVNSAEWLLTEARLEFEEEDTLASALYLGPGGPLMTAHGRSWLEEIGKRPLGLYEVRQVRPGEGITVSDLLRPEQPELWVRERSGSRSMTQWDVLGGRLACQEGDWVFTGALYPYVREDGLACRDEILSEMEGVDWDSDLAREVVSVHVIDNWLLGLCPKPLPTLVDTSTQNTIVLTTDHYRVTDWNALESILAEQADVEGERAGGWVRFTEMGGEMRRARARLNAKGGDALTVSCRTLELADETRKWLERLARTALKFRVREVQDPRSPKVLESAAHSRGRKAPAQVPDDVLRAFMANLYGNWADTAIPALANKTPRQAVESEQGRRGVIELLRSYEHAELQRVRAQGGDPFDFGFLWEELGLDRGGR